MNLKNGKEMKFKFGDTVTVDGQKGIYCYHSNDKTRIVVQLYSDTVWAEPETVINADFAVFETHEIEGRRPLLGCPMMHDTKGECFFVGFNSQKIKVRFRGDRHTSIVDPKSVTLAIPAEDEKPKLKFGDVLTYEEEKVVFIRLNEMEKREAIVVRFCDAKRLFAPVKYLHRWAEELPLKGFEPDETKTINIAFDFSDEPAKTGATVFGKGVNFYTKDEWNEIKSNVFAPPMPEGGSFTYGEDVITRSEEEWKELRSKSPACKIYGNFKDATNAFNKASRPIVEDDRFDAAQINNAARIAKTYGLDFLKFMIQIKEKADETGKGISEVMEINEETLFDRFGNFRADEDENIIPAKTARVVKEEQKPNGENVITCKVDSFDGLLSFLKGSEKVEKKRKKRKKRK